MIPNERLLWSELPTFPQVQQTRESIPLLPSHMLWRKGWHSSWFTRSVLWLLLTRSTYYRLGLWRFLDALDDYEHKPALRKTTARSWYSSTVHIRQQAMSVGVPMTRCKLSPCLYVILIFMYFINSLEKHHIRRFHRQDAWRITFLPEGFWKWKDSFGLHHKAPGNIRNGLFINEICAITVYFVSNDFNFFY